MEMKAELNTKEEEVEEEPIIEEKVEDKSNKKKKKKKKKGGQQQPVFMFNNNMDNFDEETVLSDDSDLKSGVFSKFPQDDPIQEDVTVTSADPIDNETSEKVSDRIPENETPPVEIPSSSGKKSKSKKSKKKNKKSEHFCATCSTDFTTRNKLFNHLKSTGHARPMTAN